MKYSKSLLSNGSLLVGFSTEYELSVCMPRLNELLNIHLGDRYSDAAEILCIFRNSPENYIVSLMYVN